MLFSTEGYVRSMNLIDYIADLATIVPQKITQPDGSPLKWHWSGLRVRFGKDACYAFQTALIAHDPMANDLLNGSGIDFAADETQQSIDALVSAGAFSEEIGDDLKSLGVELKTKWERLTGDPATPTADDINAARAELARRQSITDLIAHLANEIANPAISNPAVSLSDVKASILSSLQG
jgi:hypothetical protein